MHQFGMAPNTDVHIGRHYAYPDRFVNPCQMDAVHSEPCRYFDACFWYTWCITCPAIAVCVLVLLPDAGALHRTHAWFRTPGPWPGPGPGRERLCMHGTSLYIVLDTNPTPRRCKHIYFHMCAQAVSPRHGSPAVPCPRYHSCPMQTSGLGSPRGPFTTNNGH